MDANDHRISAGSGVADEADPEEGAVENVGDHDGALNSAFSAASNFDHGPSSTSGPEAHGPAHERPMSLLELIPVSTGPRNHGFASHFAFSFRPGIKTAGLALGLGCFVLVGAVLKYDSMQYSRLLAAKNHDTQTLTSALTRLQGRLDTIEASRDKDQASDLRRVLSEVKTGVAATRDFGASLAQLTSRVDHIEKDQTSRFDKLGERIDHESSAKLNDISTRLEKLEKKPPTPVLAAVAPPSPPTPPKPTPSPFKAEPGVSNETTASIEKPRPRLRGFFVEDVRDGFAVVDSRDGPQPVIAGDFIPGAGRVLRIERHGHDWAVVTTLGVITADNAQY